MERPESIRWRLSLVTRLAYLGALLLAGVVALFGFLTYRGNREHLIATSRESLQHDVQTVALKLQSAVIAVVRDIVYLSRTAAARQFARTQGAEQERWRAIVEQDFRALLEGKPSYFQVRLIGLADSGRELVRLDNNSGRIEVTPREQLQQRAGRDYFKAGLQLPPNHVYLSDISLNQDLGRITEPRIPTLRAVIQLRDEAGDIFALAVINVDLRALFADLRTLPREHTQLLLANLHGDYLVHPDETRTFATDLGREASFLRDFPAATGAEIEPVWLRNIDDGELMLCARRRLAPGMDRAVFVVAALPASELLSGLHETRRRALQVTGLVAAAAIALLVLAARPTARRLRRVTEAIARYDASAPVQLSLPGGSDEVGILAEKFVAMAEKVHTQVRSLEIARQEAEEATRTKEEFLAIMSHEIRTPMNAVIGLLRVLERNKPAPHQEPVLRSLGLAARNLMSLLNDALDFTKLKAGKIEFEETGFALVAMLTDLAVTHRPVALQKGLEFDLDLASDLPAMVKGDAVRLAQILNNLVSNALKFTDRGHVRIAAAPAAEGRVRFIIEDTGIGIAPENLDRIFAPFAQAPRKDARKFDGTGLGLSIARGLVEAQGGTLELASTPGEGSCFTVTLPFAPAEPAVPLREGEIAVPQFTGRRVLYVEDVASNREVMAATIEGTGLDLTMVETGGEALARLRTETFDLVLLDMQLPDTTGVELARVIRAEWPSLPMIAVTAQAATALAGECRAAGVAGVVLKPIEPRRLFDEMARHLGARATMVSTAVLGEIFAGQPERLAKMLGTLADEFRSHRRELERAFAADDIVAIRRIRHKAHTAIEQLALTELRTVFDEVASGNTARRPRCLELLDETARALDESGRAN